MSEREQLPYIDIKNWKGLYTKSTQELLSPEQLRVAENCDFFELYGAISKIHGSSRFLNNIYTENGTAQKISWIGFYKSADLDGTILRHVLVAAGTILGRIENGNIVPLQTGRTKDLIHDSDRLDRFFFITNQNPDRVGEGDDPVKYDGAVISKWGITAPGDEETIREAFDNADLWTRLHCTVQDQTNATTGDVTFDGDAMRIDKEFYTNDIFSVEKSHDQTFYPFDLNTNRFYVYGDSRDSSTAIANRVQFKAYFPRGSLTSSITKPGPDSGYKTKGPVMSVYVSPDSDTVLNNNWQFDFSMGTLVEGWNTVNLDFTKEAPGNRTGAPAGTSAGHFYPEVQSVGRTRFEFYTATAQTAVHGVRLDKYITLDEGAPVVTASGSGSFTGAYSYKVVYGSKYGNTSNAGPASISVTAASHGQLNLTRIPVSSDPQVTYRDIYRTVANGSVYLYLDTIYDNVTTTYTDITPDLSLGNDTPPQAGDFSDDNSVPPQAGIVVTWKKTLFMAGDPQNPYTVYFSEDNEPESFPLINTFEFDGKVTAMYETYSALIVETETSKYQVIGDNPDFSVDKIVHEMGCVGRRAAGTTKLIGYSVDRDGMRLWDSNETTKISEPIRDRYDGTDFISKTNIELIHTVHSRARNTILQFNPDDNGDYSSIFAYMYPMDNIGSGAWSDIVTPSAANLNFLHAVEIEDSNGDFKLLASGDDGMVYHLFDSDSKNWVDANGTTYAIDTKFTTPYFRPGPLGGEVEGATGRVDPRWMELRTSGDATTWNVTVETADGIDQTLARASNTIDMQFGANNSLIRQSIPSSGNIPAEYVRITHENNEASVASAVLASRLYFHVEPGQDERITVDDVTS